jgi:hypothetical protein
MYTFKTVNSESDIRFKNARFETILFASVCEMCYKETDTVLLAGISVQHTINFSFFSLN